MNWLEIILSVPVEWTDTAAAIANMTVPYGFYLEDYSDLEKTSYEIAHVDLIDEALLAKDRSHSRIHLYLPKDTNPAETLAFLRDHLSVDGVPFSIETGTVADIDWNEYWKSFFHTTEIGKRLAVVPVWETYGNEHKRVVLQINPGAAFGTGTHATTELCLTFLEELVKPGMKVLDIGCGSGILAITAVLLGADSATGVDIDPIAVKVACENAQQNGVTSSCHFVQGDLDENVCGQYHLICANIVADVIIRLCESVDNYLLPNGRLVASGVIDERADDVRRAFNTHGLTIVRELQKDHWHAFLLEKKGDTFGACI